MIMVIEEIERVNQLDDRHEEEQKIKIEKQKKPEIDS